MRSSKQRESFATFLMSSPGPHGGVAVRADTARSAAGTVCDARAAVEPRVAMVRYISRVFTASPGRWRVEAPGKRCALAGSKYDWARAQAIQFTFGTVRGPEVIALCSDHHSLAGGSYAESVAQSPRGLVGDNGIGSLHR